VQQSGKLIVFEGIEGCGKTTQLKYLHDWLTRSTILQDLKTRCALAGVIATREPGGTPLGKSIRQLLLHEITDAPMDARTELLLYAADRAQHVAEGIVPALKAGYLVLCDRYIASTVAYQGYGRQLDLALIEQLNAIATQGLVSDLTIWLRLDAEQGLARLQQRGQADRIERTGLAFHQRVQAGFEALAQTSPTPFVGFDGTLSEVSLAAKIQDLLTHYLHQWYPLQPPHPI
jgi:dTMP kinase